MTVKAAEYQEIRPHPITAAPDPQETVLRLLAAMAHELRTPLASLVASSEMLADDAIDREDRQRLVSVVSRQANRLSKVVESLLVAFQADNGRITAVRRAVDAGAILADACTEQAVLYPQHRFRTTAEPARCLVADADIVAIIVANLISNGARYSPAGSTVTVSCRDERGRLQIAVTDEGRGVPVHLRRRIFDASDRGEACGEPGFGLGLFIVRSLCEAIGAEVWVEDRPNLPGSCFVVSFPV